jgi:long-chain acyl-CoA synthetase
VGAAGAADLDAFARERLAPPKRPKEYHHLDELPRTLTGKVRRDQLGGVSRRSGDGTAAG